MPKLLVLLQNVHDYVHYLPMKPNYSGPYLYTGNVDIKTWSTLSKEAKEKALSKEWYVYYSFRNPQTGKTIKIAAKNVVKFKAGADLDGSVN